MKWPNIMPKMGTLSAKDADVRYHVIVEMPDGRYHVIVEMPDGRFQQVIIREINDGKPVVELHGYKIVETVDGRYIAVRS